MAASRTVLRSATIFLTEPSRPLLVGRASSSFSLGTRRTFTHRLYCIARNTRAPGFHFPKRTVLTCSYDETQSTSLSNHDDQGPPQEAVLKAISEVSKTEGRVGHTTNMVLGGTVTDDSSNEWIALDQKVNSYPGVRGFTAIGTGGDDFVQSMVVAVESVLQKPIPEGKVRHKLSAKGKYVSVNIGPVQVISSEQVQAVYNAMKRDDRMKYFL
ncbi:uncharacterized protein LOC111790920 [Cucurbita pepo subsp. pepo]|uniref:uncharacterized protein LOC111790920 n=1 Tax=Cucurbita pepo subsp. pepo TaxID=3664 RepID=UPI000C9D9053|nr:uncharacterized protein LOC111790920 [Cucurbita pepo subsp. pepo]